MKSNMQLMFFGLLGDMTILCVISDIDERITEWKIKTLVQCTE